MSDFEQELHDLVGEIAGALDSARREAAISLAEALTGLAAGLASAMGHLIAAASEGAVPDDVVDMGRDALLAWNEAESSARELIAKLRLADR